MCFIAQDDIKIGKVRIIVQVFPAQILHSWILDINKKNIPETITSNQNKIFLLKIFSLSLAIIEVENG